jgi:hypothetical protein
MERYGDMERWNFLTALLKLGTSKKFFEYLGMERN